MRAAFLVLFMFACAASPTPSPPLLFYVDQSVSALSPSQQGRIIGAAVQMSQAWANVGGVVAVAPVAPVAVWPEPKQVGQVSVLRYGGAGSGDRAYTDFLTWVVTWYDPAFAVTADEKWEQMAWHELGHVLQSGHIDCGVPGIMTPHVECYTPPGDMAYTGFDIEAICAGGWRGGVCQR